MAKRSRTATARTSQDATNLFDKVVSKLNTAIQGEKQKFFPNGIELLDIAVKVAAIEISVKIAGPKAAALAGGGLKQEMSAEPRTPNAEPRTQILKSSNP